MVHELLKKRNVKIYQTSERNLRFREYSEFITHTGYVSPFEFGYNMVYSDEIELSLSDHRALDKVYVTFNTEHPENFTGRSLSVSDVISIDNEYYFVDGIGFKKIIAENETNVSYFHKLMKLIKENGHYSEAEKIIEYVIVQDRDVRTLTSYEFDLVSHLCWGSNEGIYIDCYLEGKFDDTASKKLKVATIKSLETSIQAFKTMGELTGALTYYGRTYVNEHINMFEKKEKFWSK